jgi:hypothetical protein
MVTGAIVCVICGEVATIFYSIDDVMLCSRHDAQVQGANAVAQHHPYKPIPSRGASSSLSSGETQGGAAFKGQLQAIGVGWGALAIRDDPLPPPNPRLLGGDWPVVREVGCNIVSSMSLARNRREKNLNKLVSSWETW